MSIVFGVLLILLLSSVLVAVFLSIPAEKIGSFVRVAIPSVLIVLGVMLTLVGRVGIGIALAGMGGGWIMRNRSASRMGRDSGKRSTVRSAMFEMELNHDTGEMDGQVLTGHNEGRWLSSLSDSELMRLLTETEQDAESAALLEAYLDRRMPRWRQHSEADADARQRGPSGSGPMTKQEAYQILGLEPGAGPQQIREAHRRLMKRVHPDSGGSTFLASKINEAKDILLD
jgi:DnaJ domain